MFRCFSRGKLLFKVPKPLVMMNIFNRFYSIDFIDFNRYTINSPSISIDGESIWDRFSWQLFTADWWSIDLIQSHQNFVQPSPIIIIIDGESIYDNDFSPKFYAHRSSSGVRTCHFDPLTAFNEIQLYQFSGLINSFERSFSILFFCDNNAKFVKLLSNLSQIGF